MQIVLQSARERAVVDLHGATVVSWEVEGVERLYISPNAVRRHGKGIRGGVPLCFPWFAQASGHPAWPAHGVARGREWRVIEQSESRVRVELVSDDETLSVWPFPFRFEAEITIGLWLQVRFHHHNPGPDAVAVSGALHTYLRVADWRGARVHGLDAASSYDKLTGQSVEPAGDVLTIDGPIDRVFYDTPDRLELVHAGGRVVVHADAPDAVVWNPGPDQAAAMADLGEGEHAFFVCVEAASLRPTSIPAGATWSIAQRLEVG